MYAIGITINAIGGRMITDNAKITSINPISSGYLEYFVSIVVITIKMPQTIVSKIFQ